MHFFEAENDDGSVVFIFFNAIETMTVCENDKIVVHLNSGHEIRINGSYQQCLDVIERLK